jgi:hypothetical protein
MVGGQAAGARPLGEWTVSCAHGVVVGWIADGVDCGEPAAATPDP